jgi:hypothetical protein
LDKRINNKQSKSTENKLAANGGSNDEALSSSVERVSVIFGQLSKERSSLSLVNKNGNQQQTERRFDFELLDKIRQSVN